MKTVEKEKFLEGLTFASDEQKQAFETLLGDEKNLETFTRRYLRRDEGSRIADEAKRAMSEAEAKARDAEGYRKTVAEYEQSVLGDIEAKDKYEAYLKTIGVDPAKALAGLQTVEPHPVKPPAPAFDPNSLKKDFLGREEAGQLGNLLLDTQFGLQEISSEHQELFGKPPMDLSSVRAKFLDPQNKRSLREIAAEEFHFAERKKELSDKSLTEEIKRRVEEQLTAERSKQGLPAPVEDLPMQVVFEEKFAEGAAKTEHDRSRAMIDAALAMDSELSQQGVRITP